MATHTPGLLCPDVVVSGFVASGEKQSNSVMLADPRRISKSSSPFPLFFVSALLVA